MSRLLSIVLFLIVFTAHSRSPVITSFDSMWSIYMAHSIVKEGNINLDEFRPQIKQRNRFGIRKKFGHYYNYFPPGPAFFAVPFVYLYEKAPRLWCKLVPGFESVNLDGAPVPTALDLHLLLERSVASFIVALTAVLIFFIATNFLSAGAGFFLGLLFSFGTSAWSTASRALWQHGPSMLLLTAALFFIVRARKTPSLVCWAAIPLALSFVVRPTNAVAIVFFTLYVFVSARRYFFIYSALGFLSIAPFIIGSLEVYERILPSYYQAQRVGYHPQIVNAYLANLFSPNRGLFVYSPFLILGLCTLFANWRQRRFDGIGLLCARIFVFHTLAVSAFPSWWGGHCYGPRYLTETVPFLIVLLIPFLQQLSELPPLRRRAVIVGFAALCCWSFYVHSRGALRAITLGWNVIPNNVDRYPERVWDWHDPQFFRNHR